MLGDLAPRANQGGRAAGVLMLRHPPLPGVVVRGADPERYPVVAGPLAEPDVQVHVVADGVEDVGGEGGGHVADSTILPHSVHTSLTPIG